MSVRDRFSSRHLVRPAKGAILVAMLCLAWVGLALSIGFTVRARLDNRVITALAERHDRSVATSASFPVKFARAFFLLRQDRLDEAQAWVDEIGASGEPRERAALYYNLANARLRAAFTLIEQSKIDAAASNVRLAKDGYRKALTLDPQYWNAKYNLDVAMRLVRDFPQMEAEVLQEAPREMPKRLWTDLPRLPRGLP